MWLIALRQQSLAARGFPSRGLRTLSPLRLPLSGTTLIIFMPLETESANLLCQALKVSCTWVLPNYPLHSLRVQEFPLTRALLRTLTGVPSVELSLISNFSFVVSIVVPRVRGN
jgi:hypothetical protein